MTPGSYAEPRSVDAAVRLLGTVEGARCIAGGQTLVAMMNAGLVEPPLLVSLRRIRGLTQIRWDREGTLHLGAMATHAAVAADPRVRARQPLIASTAEAIAHPAIRNFGTIGGVIAHGDPGADYPAALLASDAIIEAAGPQGVRSIAAAEFFLDYLITALAAEEIVVGVCVPKPPPGSAARYFKLARVDGDYATVSVAALLAMEKGLCRRLAVAIGACGATPLRDVETERSLVGHPLDVRAIATLGEALEARADPLDDVRGSSEYRRAMVSRMVERALTTLRTQLEGGT